MSDFPSFFFAWPRLLGRDANLLLNGRTWQRAIIIPTLLALQLTIALQIFLAFLPFPARPFIRAKNARRFAAQSRACPIFIHRKLPSCTYWLYRLVDIYWGGFRAYFVVMFFWIESKLRSNEMNGCNMQDIESMQFFLPQIRIVESQFFISEGIQTANEVDIELDWKRTRINSNGKLITSRI